MDSSKLVTWCNKIITFCFYLLFGLVPLLLTPWNYELFEFNKMIAVYALTTIITTAWLVKSIQQKEFKIARTPLDIPIALFVTSQLVSSLFSIDPHVSWFGYYSRFNGGMWSILSYTLLYYAYVSNWSNKTNTSNLIKTGLVTGSLVALYGILEHFGIDKHLWVQDVQNRVFSTLGQPNWLAAYLVALIPLSFAVGKFWHIASVLFFTALLFTKSRSGLLGFAIADIIFWFMHVKTLQKSYKVPVLIHVVFLALIFFFGTGVAKIDNLFTRKVAPIQEVSQNAGPALETGGTESGTIRKFVWEGAINAWKSSPKAMLIGTGTETFAFAFFAYRPVAHNATSEWDFLYNKAHNEYLNYLATTGIFGLGSYLLFIFTFIFWFLKNNKNHERSTIDYALFAGWLSILITNFFGFSVVIVQLFFFLYPAIIISMHQTSMRLFPIKSKRWHTWIAIAVGLLFLLKIGLLWYADTLFAQGYRNNRAGIYSKSAPLLVSASAINPGEPFYHDELGSTYAALSVASAEAKNATQAGTLAKLAIVENDISTGISPANVTYWKTRTKIFYTLSAINPDLNTQAIEALQTALKLSPNDPKIYYNLAILLGRVGKNDEAIQNLRKALELKKNYRDVYYALHIFYIDMKQTKEATVILQDYLTNIDPNDAQFKDLLSK